jgi:hypothetical protein
MGNKSSKPSTATYSQVPPTVETETEMKDQKQISLERMRSSLNEINAQIASSDLTDEQKKEMTTQKETAEKAIRLLQDPNGTFDQYKAEMGLIGGSKKKSKSRANKSSAKKSSAKKSSAKKSSAKKSRAKKHRS